MRQVRIIYTRTASAPSILLGRNLNIQIDIDECLAHHLIFQVFKPQFQMQMDAMLAAWK